MKFSMTEQEKSYLLIQVTAWTNLAVDIFFRMWNYVLCWEQSLLPDHTVNRGRHCGRDCIVEWLTITVPITIKVCELNSKEVLGIYNLMWQSL